MPTNPRPLLVNSEILLGAQEAADELGFDIGPMLRHNNISEEHLRNPKGFLSFTQVVNFLNDVASEKQCPLFGFHLARHQPPLRFGPLAQLPKLCSTVAEAVTKGLRYSSAYNQASQWTLEEDGEFILLKRFHRDSNQDSLEQLHTLAVTIMIKAMGELPSSQAALTAVYLSHREPQGSERLRRYFKVPVYFNHHFNGYAVHREVAATPIPSANPRLLSLIEQQLSHQLDSDHDELHAKTKQLVRNTLGTSVCNIEGVSQALCLHPRSLQRELKTHNTSFRTIVNQVRQETAEYYLLYSDISLVDLSDVLGYRNTTAFIRAFKQSSGLPPSLWRNEQQGKVKSPDSTTKK